jgi:hypothetical protein
LQAAVGRVEVTPDIEAIRGIYSHFFTGAICGQNSHLNVRLADKVA